MKETINFIDDIVCDIIDDIKTWEEHSKRLGKVFERLKEKGITLNKDKYVFRKKEIISWEFEFWEICSY